MRFAAKATAVLAVCVLACFALYVVCDRLFNGFVREWLSETFIYRYTGQDAWGNPFTYTAVSWDRVKIALLVALCAFVLGIALAAFVLWWRAGNRRRRSLEEAAELLHDYMEGDEPIAAVFPADYAAVAREAELLRDRMRRHEEAARRDAQEKSDLVSYLAHDLKTPLASVIGYLSLLNETPDMTVEQRAKCSKIALDKALRLEKLVNEFFDITRYNLHEIVLEKENTDLSLLMVQLVEEFQPIAAANGNTVELEEPDVVSIVADPDKLARALSNILRNAVMYSTPSTPIRIRVEQEEDKTRIAFSNEGKAIPPYQLERLFDKFVRLDEARSTNTGGAGLGLAIAREITRLHGGTIAATSADGVTTFLMTLPGGMRREGESARSGKTSGGSLSAGPTAP